VDRSEGSGPHSREERGPERHQNVALRNDIDVLVIATNTQFSNPTHDEVRAWQKSNPRPRVWLWQREALERQIVRYPSVVARLFSSALSPQGQLEFAAARFWRFAQYPSVAQLKRFWARRATLSWTASALIATVAGEIANGDLETRPWLAGWVDDVESVVTHCMENILSWVVRAERLGSRTEPFTEAVAYLLLCAASARGAKDVLKMIDRMWKGRRDAPEGVMETFKTDVLKPIMQSLQWELSDVCSQKCERVDVPLRALREDETETYWKRFMPGDRPKEPQQILVMENLDAPCRAGLRLNRKRSCPLIGDEPSIDELPAYARIIADIVRRGRGDPPPVGPTAPTAAAATDAKSSRRRGVLRKLELQDKPATRKR